MSVGSEAVGLLAKTHLFGVLSAAELERTALDMHVRVYEQGQTIFCRGDPGHEVFVVVSGQVRLSVLGADARELSFNLAGDGDIFGEIAALDGGPRSANATAVTRVRLIVVAQTVLKRLMLTHPPLAEAAIMFLCARLRATSEQLEEVALCPIEMRLARYLLHRLELQPPKMSGDGPCIDLGMTQGELALLLGTSRPTVNSALASLERSGAIKRAATGLECAIGLLTQAAGLS